MNKKLILIISILILSVVGIYEFRYNNKTIETNLSYELGIKDYEDIIIKEGYGDQKVIALTFDDGPDEDYTPKILDILKENNVNATFFVTGQKVGWNPEIAKRIDAEGHEIGNHTFTHINVEKRGYGAIESEINKTQEVVKATIGKEPVLFRPPYRAISEAMLKIVKSKNMKVVLWSNIDPRDWSNPGTGYIINTIVNKSQNGNIILLHDYNTRRKETTQTIEAIKVIIPEMKKKGYSFVTVSQLIEITKQTKKDS